MPDFSKLAGVRNVRPSNTAETPTCGVCGTNPGPLVAEGTFENGEEAWFIPLCEECASRLTPEPPVAPADW
jgi:hypothetical protein